MDFGTSGARAVSGDLDVVLRLKAVNAAVQGSVERHDCPMNSPQEKERWDVQGRWAAHWN